MTLRINEFAIGFLFLPLIIFLPMWFNPIVAVLSEIAVFVSLYIFYKEEHKSDKGIVIKLNNWKSILLIIAALVLLVFLCIYSGFGGIVKAEDDWRKHHFILEQLIKNSWPVHADFEGETGVMSYYLGSYILPALVGKLTGSIFASDIALFIWGFIGLSICALLLYEFIGGNRPSQILIIVILLITFTTFIVPAKILLSGFAPDDFMGGFLWFNSHANVVFSSDFTQLRWAFAQAIPGWICTLLLLNFREKRSHWALILLASFFYSVFVFIGLFALMLMLLTYDAVNGKIRLFLKLENFILIIPAALFAVYYLALFIQPQEYESGLGFEVINWSGHIVTFILLECLWIPFIIILRKTKERDFLIAVSIYLILISFVNMGEFNDLCLRSTIPAMMVICALFTKFIYGKDISKLMRVALVALIVLMFIPDGGAQIVRFTGEGIGRDNRLPAFEDVTDFADQRGEFIVYQYYNWDSDGLIKYIIRK